MTFFSPSHKLLAEVTAEDVLEAKGMWQTWKNAVSDTFSAWTSAHFFFVGTARG